MPVELARVVIDKADRDCVAGATHHDSCTTRLQSITIFRAQIRWLRAWPATGCRIVDTSLSHHWNTRRRSGRPTGTRPTPTCDRRRPLRDDIAARARGPGLCGSSNELHRHCSRHRCGTCGPWSSACHRFRQSRPPKTTPPPIMPRRDQNGSRGLTSVQVFPSVVVQMSL